MEITQLDKVLWVETQQTVSIIMPCLNEEQSVGECVSLSYRTLHAAGLSGEVIVVDNGSEDESVTAAKANGATVIHKTQRGYGNALLAGLQAANGDILVIGDADLSYDFTETPKLIAPLQNGDYDMVLGSRLMGHIEPGSMPALHRYVGNPALTLILNRLFGLNVSDAHTGMRAITREAFQRLDLRTPGMEFASEMLIQARYCNLRVSEVPITYYPRKGSSKLVPIADGWRHLRFMLSQERFG